MHHTQFDNIIASTFERAETTLTLKSAAYSSESDRLHNFRIAAALNDCTMEQALWGMLTKHIVSIRDMVHSNYSFASDVWDEKIGDAINYLALLKVITVEGTSPSDESLMDLREKLTGSRHPSEASAEITHSTTSTNQQRDIDSIKRVADKHSF